MVLSYVSVRVAGFCSVLFGCECVVVRLFVLCGSSTDGHGIFESLLLNSSTVAGLIVVLGVLGVLGRRRSCVRSS